MPAIVGTFAAPADADSNYTIPAGACVPYESNIQGDTYNTQLTGGQISFNVGETSQSYFVCPVWNDAVNDLNTKTLRLYSKDPSGSGSNAFVKADLQTMDLTDGTLSTLCSVTSSDNAATFHANSSGTGACGDPASNDMLWVFVTLERTSTQDVRFYGIKIL